MQTDHGDCTNITDRVNEPVLTFLGGFKDDWPVWLALFLVLLPTLFQDKIVHALDKDFAYFTAIWFWSVG